jgi:hypothetical protein
MKLGINLTYLKCVERKDTPVLELREGGSQRGGRRKYRLIKCSSLTIRPTTWVMLCQETKTGFRIPDTGNRTFQNRDFLGLFPVLRLDL